MMLNWLKFVDLWRCDSFNNIDFKISGKYNLAIKISQIINIKLKLFSKFHAIGNTRRPNCLHLYSMLQPGIKTQFSGANSLKYNSINELHILLYIQCLTFKIAFCHFNHCVHYQNLIK